MKYTLSDFIESKIGIVCTTDAELSFVLAMFQHNGIEWRNGLDATDEPYILRHSLRINGVELHYGYNKIYMRANTRWLTFSTNLGLAHREHPAYFLSVNWRDIEWEGDWKKDVKQSIADNLALS